MLALAEHPRGRAFLEELVYGAARRDRERREGELEEVRQGRADAEHRAFELGAKNALLRRTISDLTMAWSRSWDCSRDPGHAIMEEALGRAAEALDR